MPSRVDAKLEDDDGDDVVMSMAAVGDEVALTNRNVPALSLAVNGGRLDADAKDSSERGAAIRELESAVMVRGASSKRHASCRASPIPPPHAFIFDVVAFAFS